MRNLDLIGILLAGIAIAVPLIALLGSWYDRRKSNGVIDLDLERSKRREPSNVVALTRREGVRVLPLPRKWGS